MFAELLDTSCSGVFIHEKTDSGWSRIYVNPAGKGMDGDHLAELFDILPDRWERSLVDGGADRNEISVDGVALIVQVVPLPPQRVATLLDPLASGLRLVQSPDDYADSIDMYLGVRASDGQITHCNQALADILEDAAEEIVGLQWADLFHPDSSVSAEQAWRRFLVEGGLRRVELGLHLSDGDQLPVAVSARGQFEGGQLIAGWFLMRDVAEQSHLEARLIRAEKLDAVGRLAGGIAHDFNNLLQVVLVYANFLVNQHGLEGIVLEDARRVFDAAEQAGRLTSRLLAFSQQRFMAPRVVDINGVVKGIASLMRRMLPENIEVHYELAEDLQRVLVDSSLVEQVVVNLLLNARDALPGGGTIVVATETVAPDDAYVRYRLGAQPETYSVLRISDTGRAMSAAQRSRIFDPLPQTGPRSAGLGLAAIRSVVRKCGGHIWVEGGPEQGTTFRVYLPNALITEPAPTPDGASRRGLLGSERILVVEDDALVRWTVQRMLRTYGYEVHTAENADEALEFVRNECPDLVVTDVVMPLVDGPTLVRRARQIREDLPVLMISGYAEQHMMADVKLDDRTAFLPKPFLPDQLAAAVRQILDSAIT